MKEFLKNIADDNGWYFQYSRIDYTNLYDGMSADTVHLFVEPITVDSTFTDSGNEIITYMVKMSLLMQSNVDETYEDKYDSYIKPLMEDALQTIKDEFRCSNFEIRKFNSTETINTLNQNLDGLWITFSATLSD